MTAQIKAIKKTINLLQNAVWRLEEAETLLADAAVSDALMQKIKDSTAETQKVLEQWGTELFNLTFSK
mgnify:FL=1